MVSEETVVLLLVRVTSTMTSSPSLKTGLLVMVAVKEPADRATHTEGQQERDSKLHLSLIQMIRNIAFIYTRLQIWLQIMY